MIPSSIFLSGYQRVIAKMFIVVVFGCIFATGISAQETRSKQSEISKAPKSAESQSNPPEPQNLDVIKVDSNLVSVPVIVSDREGRYVPNLTIERFKLFDNSTQQKISYFDAAEEPLNVAILLDTSRSTEGALDDIKNAAKAFLKELRPQDRAMIVGFDYAIHRLSLLTNDRKTLEQAIKDAKVGQFIGTTLNDAVDDVSTKVFKSVTGRKAIILLSDGQDFGSVIAEDALLDEQSESDTMVYSIFYASEPAGLFRRGRRQFPNRYPGRFPRGGGGGIFGRRGGIFDDFSGQGPMQSQRRGSRNQRGAEFLRELSEVTSGRFYQSEITDFKKTFAMIAEELRHQYRLGFYPGEIEKDGAVHQLRVKVDEANLAVRARQQYRAIK